MQSVNVEGNNIIQLIFIRMQIACSKNQRNR